MALVLSGATARVVCAEGELSSEDRTLLERLALAKARADLVEQVYALPIQESLTVGGFAARETGRDRALRLWLRSQPRVGAARVYGDNTCDADVRLDPAALREQLEQLEKEHPAAGGALDEGDLRRAAAKWPTLWGAGTAGAREISRSKKPAGWDDVSYEGIQMVKRAAEADARHALLETAAELPVTNARRLREFLDSGDAVRDGVLESLGRVAEVKVSFELDQIAVAEARIGLVELIRILTDVHQQQYRGDLFHAADFREMALLAQQDSLSATGLAVPPSQAILKSRYRVIELDAPAWAGTTLSATGRYEPGDDDANLTPQRRAEAARLDGIDRLRSKVETLPVQKDVSVEGLLYYHEDLKDDVVLFLSGARPSGPARTLDGGVVEVPVELQLRRLWLIVRRGMKAVEVEMPEGVTSQPAEKGKP